MQTNLTVKENPRGSNCHSAAPINTWIKTMKLKQYNCSMSNITISNEMVINCRTKYEYNHECWKNKLEWSSFGLTDNSAAGSQLLSSFGAGIISF